MKRLAEQLLANLQDYLFRIKRTSVGELAYRAKRLMLATRLKKAILERKLPLVVPPYDRDRVQSLKLPHCNHDKNTWVPSRGDTARPVTLNTPLEAIRAVEHDCQHLFFSVVNGHCNGIDIRAVWEPARLQHLVPYLLKTETADVSDAQLHSAMTELLQWISDNPFLHGTHYMSPMECGLRIPVFFYCLKTMMEAHPQDMAPVAEALYHHAWWIYRNLSLFNSLGNHTICECVGLIFAGAVYATTQEGKQWLTRGCGLLDQEIEHQILPDGGPAEQSTTYHRFVLDLYWLAYGFLKSNGLHPCRSWKTRLEAGESFLKAFEIEPNKYVPIGDGDDGHAIAPSLHPRRSVPPQPAPWVQTFSDTGCTVIRDEALLLTFDHGPLGMPPLYNHGHADALSISLAYRGQSVFIDPGTYRYNGVSRWRRYFKSTQAHNTVTVDGMDQANQASGFIWTQPFKSKVVDRRQSANGFSMEACHDGYCRLKAPVIHFRRIDYHAQDVLYIRDRFTGSVQHVFELNFHLGETFAIDRVNRWWRIDFGSFFVFLTVLEQFDATLAWGQTDPPLGWQAPAYGQKHPCHTLTYRRSGIACETIFTTAVLIQERL